MKAEDIAGLITLMIVIFLLANNYTGSTAVINALGGQATSTIATLQGRSTTGTTTLIPTQNP